MFYKKTHIPQKDSLGQDKLLSFEFLQASANRFLQRWTILQSNGPVSS